MQRRKQMPRKEGRLLCGGGTERSWQLRGIREAGGTVYLTKEIPELGKYWSTSSEEKEGRHTCWWVGYKQICQGPKLFTFVKLRIGVPLKPSSVLFISAETVAVSVSRYGLCGWGNTE